MDKTLLVCVDGSPYAESAFQKVLSWKKPSDKLYVVHAVELVNALPVGIGPAVAFIDPSVIEGTNEALKKRASSLVAAYAKKCEEKKLEHVTAAVLATQDPKESIVKYAKDKGVDTIFVGTRGLGAFSRFFLGSFSNYIVSHAECDVVVVRHAEEQPKKKE